MEDFAKEKLSVSLVEEMSRSYLDYAMSVIVGRALPDVRDGLKPVHRRVLYGMHEMNNVFNRPYVKCARVVGEVMGKYHPHGDLSIYDTLVRMAQDFSLRYTLVDGQGNFGSVDGDGAAAMRYTECRLERISNEMLADIEKETVDFAPNYDGKENEPVVLPARIPNLLVNGSSGIAVGMATNIPPHNITDVINGCLYALENPGCSVDDLIAIIQAPDFPTGGIIYGLSGVIEGYRTGRGRVVMRAKTHFEEMKAGHQAIIIDELPYQINKKALLERIASLVKGSDKKEGGDKKDRPLSGISDIRDESDKSGMRVVIELKRGENPDVILNNLYKFTELQSTFGINMVALVGGQPRTLNLKQIIDSFLAHRREVVTRRTIYDLRQARARGHILEGLAVALANIKEFLDIIQTSKDRPTACQRLMDRAWDSSLVTAMLRAAGASHDTPAELFRPEGLSQQFGVQEDGLYRLSEEQASEVLLMRLQNLTGLQQEGIRDEYKKVMGDIAEFIDILAKPARITAIVGEELRDIAEKYGDAKSPDNGRRSVIETDAEDMTTEDFIKSEDMVVTLTHGGYLKAQPLTEYAVQKRGGLGKAATKLNDGDYIEQLFVANSHDMVLCFTSRGRLFWVKVWRMPQGSRAAGGKTANNVIPIEDGEKITAMLALTGENRDYPDDRYVFMATSQGIVKKTPLSNFKNERKIGVTAVGLDEGDYLVGAALTDGKHDVMLFSDAGKAVRFDENDVRPMGRQARGVRGMNLDDNGNIIAMIVAENDGQEILIATENGYGKRTDIREYTRHSRGTKGMISIKTSERNGKVVAATLVDGKDDIMLITTDGTLIRTKVDSVNKLSRQAQGVKLQRVDQSQKEIMLAGVQRILESDMPSPAEDESAASDAAAGNAADEQN